MKFRSTPTAVRGSIAALMTPFDDDGALDDDSLRRLIRWQLDQGSHGISIGGSTGEPSALSTQERAHVIRLTAEEIDDAVPFLPGTGAARLDETLELTEVAQDAGADVALVITPYYARPTQQALINWYGEVCRTFPDLPIVAYNVPSRTSVDIAPETVETLFRTHDNFIGIKETTRDFEHFSHVMHRCGPELMVWSGIELLCLPLLALGGAGFISATTNLAPRASADMYNAWMSGDLETARRIHFGLHPLVELLFVETNPAPGKFVLAERGLISSPYVRPPLCTPQPTSVERIHALLDAGADYLSTPVTHDRS